MLHKFLLSAEHLFDKKLKNGTLMVLIISSCIVCLGAFNQTVSASMQANVLASQNTAIPEVNIITIAWKQYRVVLEEVN